MPAPGTVGYRDAVLVHLSRRLHCAPANPHLADRDFRLSSMRAYVFRCSPNNGHRQDTSPCPFRAMSRHHDASFDHPVGTGHVGLWNTHAKRRRCFEEGVVDEGGRARTRNSKKSPRPAGLFVDVNDTARFAVKDNRPIIDNSVVMPRRKVFLRHFIRLVRAGG